VNTPDAQQACVGQVAIVTGASRGIGAAIALTLAERGADVACLATTVAKAEPTAAAVRGRGRKSIAVGCRVEDSTQVTEAFARVHAELGPVDTLVSNAGISHPRPILEMSEADWDSHMDVNAKAVFLCAQAAARQMIAAGKGGSIINVGSIAGANAFPMRLAYCSSKATVHHATRVMAIEWAQYGIRVNCVAPGYVLTEMIQSLIDQDIVDAGALQQRTPQRKLGTPDQVAKVVAFLASQEAELVTGGVVFADGGWDAYGYI
jgi:NAD(P)-dependent dehydrogenase (short-subunit alcohol dehydrogenase family)